MSREEFHFRRFSVSQKGCGMRISTDGVLLGAWSRLLSDLEVPPQRAPFILDIGTGTGLVALMLAQRYPQSRIEAIEIDSHSALYAAHNVAASPFARTIAVVEGNFADIYRHYPPGSAGLIVSNPPYFTNGPVARDAARQRARYTGTLNTALLFEAASQLLLPNGRLALITPYEQVHSLHREALANGFRASRLSPVVTVEGRMPKRLLSEWKRMLADGEQTAAEEEILTIKQADGHYSPPYRSLVAPFYLNIEA